MDFFFIYGASESKGHIKFSTNLSDSKQMAVSNFLDCL